MHGCASKYATKPFLTMAPSGETLSYEEFETLTNKDDLTTLIVFDDAQRASSLFPHLNVATFDSIVADDATHISRNVSDLSTASVMFTSGTTGVSKVMCAITSIRDTNR